MKNRTTAGIVGVALCLVSGLALVAQTGAQTAPAPMPAFKRQATPKAVVDEHLDALNHCDWARLMAQYPPEVEFFMTGGQVVKGRQQVGELFAALVKPFSQGGLCGVKFEAEHTFSVGGTLNVQWKATGDVLAEPYRGADAYVTRNGLLWAIVTTFQKDQLKAK